MKPVSVVPVESKKVPTTVPESLMPLAVTRETPGGGAGNGENVPDL